MKKESLKNLDDLSKKITYPLELKDLGKEGTGEFCGYASVFDEVDSHGDVVKKGAFLRSLEDSSRKPLLWQHDPEIPIGVIDEIYEDDYGLFVRGKFLLEIEKAREAYALVKSGSISGLSIGYIPRKILRTSDGRVLTEVELLEVSLVTFASNSLAKITEVKNVDELWVVGAMIRDFTKNIRKMIGKM